jgi:hypothetical protein
MRLTEIVELAERDEDPVSYAHHLLDAKQVMDMPNGMRLKVSRSSDMIHLGVYDGYDIASYVGLHKEGQYWQVDMQCSSHPYRNQGHIRYCIEYAVRTWGPIISDWQQTPSAKSVWKALINKPNTVAYKLLDTGTGEITPFRKDHQGNITPDPWDDRDDKVIIAEARILSEHSLNMRQRRAQLDASRGRRDPWLGVGFLEPNP